MSPATAPVAVGVGLGDGLLAEQVDDDAHAAAQMRSNVGRAAAASVPAMKATPCG
jgi:hypothetical protein